MKKRKTAVIGAGPAGIIAAGFSSEKGNDVTLYEKNDKIGKKLFITGKGRCNVTNSGDVEELLEAISYNKSFMYSSLYTFTNYDIMSLIESYGVKLKVERGNRVFPESDKSSDILKAFNKFLKEKDVKIKYESEVKEIIKENDKFYIITDKKEEYDSIIITTGGKSYPVTGSTGDGHRFAKKFGHEITKLKPSLVPIETKDTWIKELQGLSLKNVKITSSVNGKEIYSELGEMIFTHYGISGPIILRMSNFINKYTDKKINISLDLKPGLDYKKLDNRIIRDFNENLNKSIKNILKELLPNRLIPVILNLSKIDEDKVANQITKEERLLLEKNIKEFPIEFKGFRPIEEAIVTSGGISLKEIDPSTMESKILKNLFFAGEVIDIDAVTGGYNLQVAYSTGYLAGKNS